MCKLAFSCSKIAELQPTGQVAVYIKIETNLVMAACPSKPPPSRFASSRWPGLQAALWAMFTVLVLMAALPCLQEAVDNHIHAFSSSAVHVMISSGSAATSGYAIFSRGAWSRSVWGRNCTSNHGRHLCSLPTTWFNCSSGIYLDIGTNVGVQLRKLYNPEQFINAPVLPIFNKVFGSNRSAVCAIGVEANPSHTEYLQTLNAYFHKKNNQAVVLTEHAASVRKGSATFHQDSDSPVEWGASLSKGSWQKNHNKTSEVTVALLDLPAFMVDVVRPILVQEQQATGARPPVVMKLDVEGEEYALLPGLILTGSLCDLDVIFMEEHSLGMRNEHGVDMTISEVKNAFSKMRKANPLCTVDVSNLDDETYRDGTEIPLPS